MLKSLLFSIALLAVSCGVKANTYYVTTVSDTGAGSLRAMIDSANTHSGLDTISLSLGLHDIILLGSALPTITDSLVITGMPCQNPTIDGDSISFGHPAFYVSGNSKPLTLNYLNIFNCKTSASGKAGAVSAPYLYMNYCCFFGNSNVSDSATAGTAGVAYSPWLTASNCTFTSNSCTAPANNFNAGAGALVSGNGNLSNCTFYGNYSASYGGALNGSFNITNCTIANNYAGIGGGGLFSSSATGSFIIANNIVWGNTINPGGNYLAGINLNAGVTSGGCNILQDVAAIDSFKTTGTDVTGTDPQFGTFGYYSGCVPVLPILCGSVAQNHASCSGATATDAEGIAAQGIRDAGAFEITHPHLGGDTIDSIQPGTTANLYNYFNTTGLTIIWPAGITDSSAASVDTGSYTVIGTNFLGCSDTATAIVRFYADTLNTGIKTPGAIAGFSVYPNPAKDVAIVSWRGNIGGEFLLRVNDMLGRIVISQEVNAVSGKYNLNTNTLVSGVYCITVQQGDQKMFSGRLIVIGR